jgi:hypothetical protein
MFSHVVIFWTDPANPKAADELLAGMDKYLRPIPGVLHFHAGREPSCRRRSNLPGRPQHNFPRQENPRRLPNAPVTRRIRQHCFQKNLPKSRSVRFSVTVDLAVPMQYGFNARTQSRKARKPKCLAEKHSPFNCLDCRPQNPLCAFASWRLCVEILVL